MTIVGSTLLSAMMPPMSHVPRDGKMFTGVAPSTLWLSLLVATPLELRRRLLLMQRVHVALLT
eukprot:14167651-Heterocapsa_arctica.AAC.1